MKRSEAVGIRKALDNLVVKLALVNEDAFNSSAAEINENAAAFRVWLAERDYARGDVTIDPDDNCPYWAMHNHGPSYGQIHQPSKSPTVWTHCHGTTPETAREFIAEGHNPYHAGHYCRENSVIAMCNTDNTVHPPSVLPQAWDIVSAE